MGFSFAMRYNPDYQRRYGKCALCHQGIEAGEKIMLGTGYFNHKLIKKHYHFECWLKEVPIRAKDWFFKYDYKPRRMAPEKKAELNRLRAKRYYISRKGGEPNVTSAKLAVVEKQITLVKAS